jgi:hypothetical protein
MTVAPERARPSAGEHGRDMKLLGNAVASSTEQREVDCTKKEGTRASETALEPQLIKVMQLD